MHVWNFAPVWANADLLALGLLNTLKVTGAALAFGVPLGLLLALMRLSPRRLLRWPAGAVIEFFRTTPPLVQLFWFFFALPILIGVEMTPYVAAVLTFSIQSAAFFAEVFRGGIVSIERGQWEAARALGMAPRQVMRRDRAAAGGEADDPGLPRARDRADEDDDAGRDRVVRRPAVPDQRGGAEDVPAAGGVHGRRR